MLRRLRAGCRDGGVAIRRQLVLAEQQGFGHPNTWLGLTCRARRAPQPTGGDRCFVVELELFLPAPILYLTILEFGFGGLVLRMPRQSFPHADLANQV